MSKDYKDIYEDLRDLSQDLVIEIEDIEKSLKSIKSIKEQIDALAEDVHFNENFS